jgi:hypothetical protein
MNSTLYNFQKVEIMQYRGQWTCSIAIALDITSVITSNVRFERTEALAQDMCTGNCVYPARCLAESLQFCVFQGEIHRTFRHLSVSVIISIFQAVADPFLFLFTTRCYVFRGCGSDLHRLLIDIKI